MRGYLITFRQLHDPNTNTAAVQNIHKINHTIIEVRVQFTYYITFISTSGFVYLVIAVVPTCGCIKVINESKVYKKSSSRRNHCSRLTFLFICSAHGARAGRGGQEGRSAVRHAAALRGRPGCHGAVVQRI